MCELCSFKIDGGSLLGYKFKCGLTNSSPFKSWGIFTKHQLGHTPCYQEAIKQQGTFSVGDQSQDCNSSLVKTRQRQGSIMERTGPEGRRYFQCNGLVATSYHFCQASVFLLKNSCSRTPVGQAMLVSFCICSWSQSLNCCVYLWISLSLGFTSLTGRI